MANEQTAGAVSVLVKADISAFEKGMASARKAADDFDKQASNALKGTGAASKMMADAAKQADAAMAAMGKTAEKNSGLIAANTNALRLNRVGMMELQAAGINSFQALAAGMDPFHVAMMESGQVVGAFVQGTEGGFTALKAAAVGSFEKIGAEAVALRTTLRATAAYAVAEPLAAITTAINPVTLGLGLAAGAAYLLWNSMSGPDEKAAEDSLRRTKSLIDEIAKSFPDAAAAAKQYVDQTSRLTQAEALVSANAELAKAKDNYSALTDQIDALLNRQKVVGKGGFANTLIGPYGNEIRTLVSEFDDGVISARRLADEMAKLHLDPGLPPSLQGLVDQFASIANQAQIAGTNVATLNNLIAQLGAPSGTQGRTASLRELMSPTGYSDLVGALRKQASELNSVATKRNPYEDLMRSAQARIDQVKAEIAVVGQGTAASETFRYQQQLLSQAMAGGNTITAKQRAEIEALAKSYGDLAQQLALSQLANNTAFARAQMGRSPIDQTVASQLRDIYGNDYLSHMNDAIAGQIRMNEEIKLAQGYAQDFLSTFEQGLKAGETAWQAFGDAAIRVLEEIAQKLVESSLNSLISSLLGGFGGGGLFGNSGGLAAGAGAGALYAKGGAFGPAGPIPFAKGGAFTNSIVTQPTLFRFAGGTGLMGEAGKEGILPLGTDSRGRLGVHITGRDAGGDGSGVAYADNRIFNIDARGAQVGVAQQITAALREYDTRMLPQSVRRIANDPHSRGG